MKQYEFQIDSFQAEWISKPIRTERDSLLLLMNTVKIMLLPPQSTPAAVGNIILQIDKMSRLFYIVQNKIFTLNFPFAAQHREDALKFHSIHHTNINSVVVSQIVSILEGSESFDSREILTFAEPIFYYCESDEDFWCVLRELILSEDGYARYDFDPERVNGHLHPLHHLDIFYSGSTTFKLGLRTPLSSIEMIDLFSINTNCHYLAPSA